MEWKHVDQPTVSDWLGLYTVPEDGTIDPTKNAPVKFQVNTVSLVQG